MSKTVNRADKIGAFALICIPLVNLVWAVALAATVRDSDDPEGLVSVAVVGAVIICVFGVTARQWYRGRWRIGVAYLLAITTAGFICALPLFADIPSLRMWAAFAGLIPMGIAITVCWISLIVGFARRHE